MVVLATHGDTRSIIKCMFSYLVLYHYCHFLFYQQIFSEFNHIFEKEIIKDIKEVWSEMVPKIFDVTKNESNAKLKSLYEESILKVWLDTITTQYSYWLYTWHFAECKSLFASMMLVHLLPNTRTAATTSRILVFINVSENFYILH